MKERGIIFNSEEVRAILEGKKTRFRRILKEHIPKSVSGFQFYADYFLSAEEDEKGLSIACIKCPYEVGDRLWVRERHYYQIKMSQNPDRYHVVYDIPSKMTHWSNFEHDKKSLSLYKWRPPIHMPRWASRITLEITDVRVEKNEENIWEWVIGFKRIEKE